MVLFLGIFILTVPNGSLFVNRTRHLVAITGTTILIPCIACQFIASHQMTIFEQNLLVHNIKN